jgi:hypothetical protein
VYWSSCCPHADKILPEFPAPHKRLSGPVIERDQSVQYEYWTDKIPISLVRIELESWLPYLCFFFCFVLPFHTTWVQNDALSLSCSFILCETVSRPSIPFLWYGYITLSKNCVSFDPENFPLLTLICDNLIRCLEGYGFLHEQPADVVEVSAFATSCI